MREYDLIGGLTGLGAYLLHRHGGGDLLHSVLSYPVRLTTPLSLDGQQLPGWWSSDGPDGRPSPDWPGGHANLGLAHGIAGPLALLAATVRHGIAVPGHAEAIGRICAWLDRCRTGTGTTAWWPQTLTHAEHRTATARQPGPGRPAWCYGTPGLARAHQLAAIALDEPQRRRMAEDALAGCLTDTRQLARLNGASLCHGWAGLLLTTWRIRGDCDDPDRFDLSTLLRRTAQVLHRPPPADDSLLDGRSGARLAWHTVTAGAEPASGWDACLLLQPPTRHHPHGPRTRSGHGRPGAPEHPTPLAKGHPRIGRRRRRDDGDAVHRGR
jgi:hypothetical protein